MLPPTTGNLHRDASSLIDRVSVNAATDGGKGDAVALVVASQLQAALVDAGQLFGLTMTAPIPNGAHGMQHETSWEVAGTRYHG